MAGFIPFRDLIGFGLSEDLLYLREDVVPFLVFRDLIGFGLSEDTITIVTTPPEYQFRDLIGFGLSEDSCL